MIPIDANRTSPLPFDSVGAVDKAAGARSKQIDSPDEKKLKKAAGDFESLLLASMWKSMKKSFTTPEGEESDPAHGTLEDWGIEVMAGAVGKAGGLGIGWLIIDHLAPAIEQPIGDQDVQPAAKLSENLADRVDSKGTIGI